MRRGYEDTSYQDFHDEVFNSMNMDIFGAPYNVQNASDYVIEERLDWFCEGTTLFFIMLLMARWEIEHNLLEDRVIAQVRHYIPQYLRGDFEKEIFPEERGQVEADVRFVEAELIQRGIPLADPDEPYDND